MLKNVIERLEAAALRAVDEGELVFAWQIELYGAAVEALGTMKVVQTLPPYDSPLPLTAPASRPPRTGSMEAENA